MDCCGEEGGWKGDAKFEIKKVADGVHVAVAAPAYKVKVYGEYRPWRTGLAANVERTYAMVS